MGQKLSFIIYFARLNSVNPIETNADGVLLFPNEEDISQKKINDITFTGQGKKACNTLLV